MTDLSGLAKHPVTTVAVGATATALGLAAETYLACERLPFVGSRLRGVRGVLERRGEDVIAGGLEPQKATNTPHADEIDDRELDEHEQNALVRERVDLIGLADEVVAGIDLPTIIRESTGGVTAEVMGDVRSQGERADDVVSGLVDRILGRDKGVR